MKIGLHCVNFDVPGGIEALPTTLASAARTAEQAGVAWFTMADHFIQMDNLWPAESPMLEVYTSLGYLAGQTERIKLDSSKETPHTMPLAASFGRLCRRS
jgi:alkanesulfonate monooxygenase SsuD/methylene tetrahydromethanopterin reductase-like flavin-dependent oxidoreductase (luciferase family)